MDNVLKFPERLPQLNMPVFTMQHKGMEWNLPVSMVEAVVAGKRPIHDIPEEFLLEMLRSSKSARVKDLIAAWLQDQLNQVE